MGALFVILLALYRHRTYLLANHYFTMLLTIAVILLLLWAVGLVTSYTLGGFIHLLLVIAIIMILVRLIQGKNPIA